jgi:hypothetical protein
MPVWGFEKVDAGFIVMPPFEYKIAISIPQLNKFSYLLSPIFFSGSY